MPHESPQQLLPRRLSPDRVSGITLLLLLIPTTHDAVAGILVYTQQILRLFLSLPLPLSL